MADEMTAEGRCSACGRGEISDPTPVRRRPSVSDGNIVLRTVVGFAQLFWFVFRPAFIGLFVLVAGLVIGVAFTLAAGLVGGIVLQVFVGSWSGITSAPLAIFMLAVGAIAMLQTMGNVAKWFGG